MMCQRISAQRKWKTGSGKGTMTELSEFGDNRKWSTQNEHVAKWIGCWTRDQKVWGSIPSAGHVEKCRANFSFHTASAYPAMMSTWWNKKLENCESDISCRKCAEFSSEDMRPYKKESSNTRGVNCKVC